MDENAGSGSGEYLPPAPPLMPPPLTPAQPSGYFSSLVASTLAFFGLLLLAFAALFGMEYVKRRRRRCALSNACLSLFIMLTHLSL